MKGEKKPLSRNPNGKLPRIRMALLKYSERTQKKRFVYRITIKQTSNFSLVKLKAWRHWRLFSQFCGKTVLN
jgi:hypothetical protein